MDARYHAKIPAKVVSCHKQDKFWLLAGCAALAGYSLLVNSVRWDFSKPIGVHVAFFALASVLCGRFVLRENVPPSTWLGLAVIFAGGLIIQLGGKLFQ